MEVPMYRKQFARRSFLVGGLATAGAVFPNLLEGAAKRKKILVVGGTTFLGPAITETAVVAGYDVTLFNRGLTHSEWFPSLEKLRGLRHGNPQQQDLTALNGRHWDAVVDVWPFDPVLVGSLAEFMKDRTDHYLYVSSCSAYDDDAPPPTPRPKDAEDLPTRAFESAPEGFWKKYGVGKAESERRVRAAFGNRCTLIRPGVIKGYRDALPWAEDFWLYAVRIQHGGKQIAPGTGDDTFQLIDVRDVAYFVVKCIKERLYGAFNVAGEVRSFRNFLATCKQVTLSDAELVWIPQSFLHDHSLEPRKNFPFWSPNPKHIPYADVDYAKAKRAGLYLSPLEAMVSGSLEWYADCFPRDDFQWTFLPSAKEKEVLAAWSQHTT
jgi:2'-hydroxyisoflavone reductase